MAVFRPDRITSQTALREQMKHFIQSSAIVLGWLHHFVQAEISEKLLDGLP